MSCQICQKSESKYKCPTCRINYCSGDCWNEHKTTKCEPPPQPMEECKKRTEYFFETEDTVPLEKLELLKGSKNLRKILENRHVRHMLTAIDKSQNATEAMKAAMLEPIFVEFADECLKIVEPETGRS
ncbi:unnamed protein product [Bemisia tabaci]|uniref:Zinc finger HIT domain-containing protein 3 n=1 Tax=Bemisia tabaci TaxID=7038 RepID=A0A9P0FAB6_BEMTA|nr:unnamed protein product [Bemisia tabaci]